MKALLFLCCFMLIQYVFLQEPASCGKGLSSSDSVMMLNNNEKLWITTPHFFHVKRLAAPLSISISAYHMTDMVYLQQMVEFHSESKRNAIFDGFGSSATRVYDTNVDNNTLVVEILGQWQFFLSSTGYNSASVEERLRKILSVTQLQILYNDYQRSLLKEKLKPWAHNVILTFNDSVTVSSLTWTEITPYTKEFYIPFHRSSVQVTLSVPLSGNQFPVKRSRIQLLFDGVPISDASVFGTSTWQLVPITMNGMVTNVAVGIHTIKVRALVDGGTLNFPHYNRDLVEHTQSPAIFASLSLVGLP
jgi:hypothetical protein